MVSILKANRQCVSQGKKIALLCFILFVFFLPLYEAPKNIFSVFFVGIGGWVALKQENAFERIVSADLFLWAFFILAMSPFIAGIGSPYMNLTERFLSALNWSLMPLVSLVLYLIKFNDSQVVLALRAFSIGTVVGVWEAFYSWGGVFPELNSVGHVNQSAIYLAFCASTAGLLLIKRAHYLDLTLFCAVVFAILSYQAAANSLVGFATSVTAIGCVLVIFFLERKSLNVLYMFFLGVVLTSALAILPSQYLGPYQGLKQEFDDRINYNPSPYSERDRLFNSALEVAGNSLTGFGLGSFGSATSLSEIRRVVEGRMGDWEAEQDNYFSSSHGHNLFTNLLVERGWIGVTTVVGFLAVLAFGFGKAVSSARHQIGLLTTGLICLGGLGQSTLHVEHGQLALLCLAFCGDSKRSKKMR